MAYILPLLSFSYLHHHFHSLPHCPLYHHPLRETDEEAMEEEVQPLAALEKLAGLRTGLGYLESQNYQVMKVGELNEEGDEDGSGGVTECEGAAAAVGVAAAAVGGWSENVRNEEREEVPGQNLNHQQDQGGYGCLAGPRTAPSWHLREHQRESIDWLLTYS